MRHRGTFGGALAHADPAGDLPAVALALDAEFVIAGPGGRRTEPAASFFVDYLTTTLTEGEILVEVRVPKLAGEWGMHYEKFQRVAQAWSIVAVAAAVRRENGHIAEARIGLTNMGPTPLRATATEAALAGAEATADAIAAAAAQAAEGTSPSSDLNACGGLPAAPGAGADPACGEQGGRAVAVRSAGSLASSGSRPTTRSRQALFTRWAAGVPDSRPSG